MRPRRQRAGGGHHRAATVHGAGRNRCAPFCHSYRTTRPACQPARGQAQGLAGCGHSPGAHRKGEAGGGNLGDCIGQRGHGTCCIIACGVHISCAYRMSAYGEGRGCERGFAPAHGDARAKICVVIDELYGAGGCTLPKSCGQRDRGPINGTAGTARSGHACHRDGSCGCAYCQGCRTTGRIVFRIRCIDCRNRISAGRIGRRQAQAGLTP